VTGVQHVRCGGKQDIFHCKILAESKGEQIFKIGQSMPKLCTNIESHVFIDSQFSLYHYNKKMHSVVTL